MTKELDQNTKSVLTNQSYAQTPKPDSDFVLVSNTPDLTDVSLLELLRAVAAIGRDEKVKVVPAKEA